MNQYFSDRENGAKAMTEQIIYPIVWNGLFALVNNLLAKGAFGNSFPWNCQDGNLVIFQNPEVLKNTVKAEMPGLAWPLELADNDEPASLPPTPLILDLLEFVHKNVAKPSRNGYHAIFKHDHLDFDIEAGQSEFRDSVNNLFYRNSVAYEFNSEGKIIRTLPPILGIALVNASFHTGDTNLDNLLEESRKKFLNPNSTIRLDALKVLWDAWERLKSLKDADSKKKSIKEILDLAANEPKFRKELENEATCLTNIGNAFSIRHSEITQTPLADANHIDYLFHRLFTMIQLLIKNIP